MNEQDKATSIMPETSSERLLKKIERKDTIIRSVQLIVLTFISVFNIFFAVQTLDARQANIQRQDELKDYIKCILLIRYDSTPEQLATRKGGEAALDHCASADNR